MSYSKILIKGKIEVITGLHIGGTDSYSAIGAVDSPVVRDVITGNPIIPGSSLKGKMRTLLQKTFGASSSHDNDNYEVLRLFGSSGSSKEIFTARLKFNDCFMNEERVRELKSSNIRLTEVKTENSIDRLKAQSNPRQIERVVRSSLFDFEIIYDVLDNHENEVKDDFKNIELAMKLLQNDCLGGHGSRGSGRIKFKDIKIESLYGDFPEVKLEV